MDFERLGKIISLRKAAVFTAALHVASGAFKPGDGHRMLFERAGIDNFSPNSNTETLRQLVQLGILAPTGPRAYAVAKDGQRAAADYLRRRTEPWRDVVAAVDAAIAKGKNA